MHFQVSLEPLRGNFVWEHDIAETIGKLAHAEVVCLFQVLAQQFLDWCAGFTNLHDSASCHCFLRS